MAQKILNGQGHDGRVFTYHFWVGVVTAILCMYGITPQVGGVTLRPEKILILCAFFIFITSAFLRGRMALISKPEALLGFWIFISIVSSLLSANPSEALRHTLDLGLSISIFFIASSWHIERVLLFSSRPILKAGVLLGVGSAFIAVLYLSGVIGYFPWFYEFVQEEFIRGELVLTRIKMTMWEANLLGAVMMVFALISIAEFKRRSFWSWFCLIVCHTGLLIAYSRGPILGYFCGLLVYSHLLGYRRFKQLLAVVVIVGVILITLQFKSIILGTIDESSYMRFSTLTPRLLAVQTAMEDFSNAPLLGSGTYSTEFLHPGGGVIVGADEDAKGWISVLPVAVLHDTGIVGFLIFNAFFVVIIKKAFKTIRYLRSLCFDVLVLRRMAAWVGAAIGMLVLSISTSAYSLAAFWMVMAIVASIPTALYRFEHGVGTIR